MKRAGVVLILILAFCGVADSAYIAQHQADGTPLICSIGSLSGCNIVTTSPYSSLLGIPVADYGILFYGIVFVLAALELVVFDELLRRSLMWLAFLGAAVSLYLVFIEVFIIGALCVYCLASAVVALLIFALAIFVHVKQKNIPSASLSPAPRPLLSMPPPAP